MCHVSVKTTRLLLGIAKYKEYTSQHIKSICNGCIKTTRVLLGVAKYKESKKDDEMTYDMKGNMKIRSAIRQHAYSWASPNTRSIQTITKIACVMNTGLLLGVAKYKESKEPRCIEWEHE